VRRRRYHSYRCTLKRNTIIEDNNAKQVTAKATLVYFSSIFIVNSRRITIMFAFIGLALLLYVTYRLYQHIFPSPNIDPHGKYVLISGCDSGFGHQLAIELDKQGFHVFAGVYTANNKDSLIKQLSSRAIVFPLDITQQQDIDSAFDLIKQKTNTLHAIINNAGISRSGYIDWITVELMRKTMDVNFFGHVAMTKKFLPLLIAKRDSRVVNICSMYGFISGPAKSAYCASKYALESFSDCLRREMMAWDLKVSIIEPGFMRTPMIEGHNSFMRDLLAGLPADVKDRWGDEFFKFQIKQVAANVFIQNAENPSKVVRALRHAVMNTVPCIRYRPGWQSSIFFFPLSMCPAWLADLVIARIGGSGVLPAGVRKQLTE
jgi:NAD(P)-dependent dehydrogenase (short-subunit alcohol dehydrogenase family)